MSKPTSKKERIVSADPFLIKRTVSAPTSERRESLSKSAQYYHEQDGGKQRRPPGTTRLVCESTENHPLASSSSESSKMGRESVKDPNVYRSKSKPLEQPSVLVGGRRGSRDSAATVTSTTSSTDGSAMEFELCRRGLQKLVSQRSLSDKDCFEAILDHCNRLEGFVRDLVSDSLELCSRQDFGAKIWNCSHYFVIEAMRKQLQESSCVPVIRDQLLKFLSCCINFYSDLVKSTEASCGFEVSQLVSGRAGLGTKSSRRMVMIGVGLCQWCFIYLGDLARYREQLAAKPDWSKPREYYFSAQQLAPKDGRPYNQLAVIAISAQRRLDAIYFYMRSLAAKNPCLSAHDSLVGIFEDTCRKAKRIEEEENARSKVHKEHKSKGPNTPPTCVLGKGLGASRRKETWIMPGTETRSPKQHTATTDQTPDSTDQFENVATSELNRKLTSAFLVAHGKLFTKIGIESFKSSLKKFIILWSYAMRTQMCKLEPSQTLKMTVINIFNIDHVAQNSVGEAGKKLYCGMAFNFGLDFCTAILQRCFEQLELSTSQAPAENDLQQYGHTSTKEGAHSPLSTAASHSLGELDPIALLLPAVKLWFDWLDRQQNFWTSFLQGVDRNTLNTFWGTVFQFLNKCIISYQSELSSVSLGPKPPLLWEDKMTAGFMPLKGSVSTEETFTIVDAIQLSPQEHHMQFLLRLSVIAKICKDLCGGLGNQLGISYDAAKEQFFCTPLMGHQVQSNADQELEEGLKAGWLQEDTYQLEPSEEILEEEEEGDDESVKELPQVTAQQKVEGNTLEEDLAIDQLKKERDKLSKEVEFHHHAIENAQTLITEAINKASEEVHIEPKYLVPDTNCFISRLAAIQALVKSQLFVVAVPLIVMEELDGLSKDSEVESRAVSARQALDYARTEVLNRSNHLKLLTTQGSLLSSLSLKEQVGEQTSNDNLILRSSQQLHIKMDKGMKYPKDGDFYSVVLLTDDRNLRVKAHANRLPVKDMSAFMLMAKLPQ